MTEEESGLEKVVRKIQGEGLPSAEQMRAEIREHDPVEQKARAFEEKLQELKSKLPEYKGLFDRWTGGENLADDEMRRMTDLSDEFAQFVEQHELN